MLKLTKNRYLLCLALALTSASCAAIEPMPETINSPAESQQIIEQINNQNASESWSERASDVLVNALSLTGIKYSYGGNSPETGFDCSGFVRYVFKQAASLTLPHSAVALSKLGETVSKNELQPGDLVFFNTLKSAFSHVGIYLGNNRFIHSPRAGGQVRIESMQTSYWEKRFNGAQRLDTQQNISIDAK